jgi:hypothetical protein
MFVFAVLVCAGCYMRYQARPGTIAPSTASVRPDQRVATWNKAITVLLADGWVPQVLNEGSCYVGARRRDDLENDILSGALASVQVDPAGTVIVQVSGAGMFRSQTELDATVKAAQDQILASILGAPAPPPRR